MCQGVTLRQRVGMFMLMMTLSNADRITFIMYIIQKSNNKFRLLAIIIFYALIGDEWMKQVNINGIIIKKIALILYSNQFFTWNWEKGAASNMLEFPFCGRGSKVNIFVV